MIWRPTKAELEMIADMATARLPNETIAATLGVNLEAFVNWALRAANAVEPPCAPSDSDRPKPSPEPPEPKILAERLFETSGD